jgi:hypothetical protein
VSGRPILLQLELKRSRDACIPGTTDKLYCALRSPYAVLKGGVSNRTGQIHPLDRVVVSFAPAFLPRDRMRTDKAGSLLELLHFKNASQYGGGPFSSSDSLFFGPYQQELPEIEYPAMQELRHRFGWHASNQTGPTFVRGFEAGRRGEVICVILSHSIAFYTWRPVPLPRPGGNKPLHHVLCDP